MINKSLKKIFTDKEIKSIPSLKENLRPTEVDPETYYKITEIFERK